MYTAQVLWLSIFASLAAGFAIGMTISRKISSGRGSAQELESHLQEIEEKQEAYQAEVNGHFTQTAELLNRLADSYREVHNHLAQGADRLCSETQPNLQAIPDQSQEQVTMPDQVEPPLDYADSRGQLNEEFGLEKVASEAVPEPPKSA